MMLSGETYSSPGRCKSRASTRKGNSSSVCKPNQHTARANTSIRMRPKPISTHSAISAHPLAQPMQDLSVWPTPRSNSTCATTTASSIVHMPAIQAQTVRDRCFRPWCRRYWVARVHASTGPRTYSAPNR